MKLTTEVKKYKAILKDWRELYWTEKEHQNFLILKKRWNWFLWVVLPGYEWEIWAIKEVIELEPFVDEYYYYCEFWNKHHRSEDCNCWRKIYEKWGVIITPLKFLKKLDELYPNTNRKEITKEMQIEVIKYFKNGS